MGSSPLVSASTEQNLPESYKAEIDRLRTCADLWRLYAPEWDLYLAAYEGGPQMTQEKNLFRHFRENQEDFADRAARVHYINYCEPLTSYFTNYIFTETIQRDGGVNEKWFQDFIKNVDKKGSDLDCFMRSISDDMQIFGMTYVLVDTPQLPQEIGTLSVAQEQQMGVRPYWVRMRPDEITDWVVDEFDNFEYVKRKQIVSKVYRGSIKVIEKYTEWYLDHIQISNVDVTDPAKPELLPAERLDNPLGQIPIYVVRFKRSKRNPHMGNSFLTDFAYNNREVMNLTSLLQEFLYRQCFNILAKEQDNMVPFKSQEDGVMGTTNTIEYPKGANAPAYIMPPSEPAQFIASERQNIVNSMFQRAAQDMVNELSNGGKSSGFSQAQSFSRTVPHIASRADVLEKTEHALVELTLQFLGKEWDGKIKYKDRYEITNITDAITQLTSIFRDLMLPSPTFAKQELKRLVYEMDAKIPADQMQKIMAEIDGLDFSKWQDIQEQALVGSKGNSTADQQKPKSTGTMAEAQAEAKADDNSSPKNATNKTQ